MINRRLVLVLGLSALILLAAGCGDDDPVTFGEGEIPSSVPDDFPVPAGAVVGSTLVDRVNHRTEFAFTIAQEADAVVQYYTVGLVSAGFVVTSSESGLDFWQIEFSRGELLGQLIISPGGSGLAAVVASFNTA